MSPRPSPSQLAVLVAGLMPLAGCCGGYSVVSTTFMERAEVRGAEVAAGTGAVLHYSRLGEPPNACGSGSKYSEDLWIQVPSLSPGPALTVGAPGVSAMYRRDQDGNPVRATGVTGTIRIKERIESGFNVRLEIKVALPSGETIKLDDDYAFHPRSGGE
jgi:hypothetical protein